VAEVEAIARIEIGLHVADDVLVDEVREQALVDEVHHRRDERQQVGCESLHLLGHLDAGHALAHERLVDVHVEEAHLGVGDLRERLAVDARELQEGDQRQARRQHGGRVAQQLELAGGDLVRGRRGQPERRDDALDQRRLEARLLRRLLERVRRHGGREQLRQVAEGQPPALAGGADLLERVAALAHARDEPRVRDGGRRPAAVVLRDQPAGEPAAQRRRRRTDLEGDPRG